MSAVELTLERQTGIEFEVRSASGHVISLDGPPAIGGADAAMRPMELMLAGIAGCASVDVVHILNKGRQPFTHLSVKATGHRADAVPAAFTHVELHFVANGGLKLDRLERAAMLSVTQYCSAAASLHPDIKLTWTCEVV